MHQNTNPTYFENRLTSQLNEGVDFESAAINVIDAYLLGKPLNSNKKVTVNKDKLFWSSAFLYKLSNEILYSDAFIQALTRYFSAEKTSHFNLIEHIAYKVPESIIKAIKRSEIVLTPSSSKWIEIKQLSERMPVLLGDVVTLCKAFQKAHQERKQAVSTYQAALVDLSAFELLSYAGLYSFKYHRNKQVALDGSEISVSEQFRAVRAILEWKLRTSTTDSFRLSDNKIGQSLQAHLSPMVFAEQMNSSLPELYFDHFEKLVQAQVELDGFLDRSITPFCFDESCEYYLSNGDILMRKIDEKGDKAWLINGNKQILTDGYWFNRGFILFVTSGLDKIQLGKPENQEQNQIAYVKSLGVYLQLSEIYGLNDKIYTSSGVEADIHKALLSLELMIAFYSIEFIAEFNQYTEQTGDWQKSLELLAMSRVTSAQEIELRLPITWSNWDTKAEKITGWTVSEEFPKGDINTAKAVLDFWSLDFQKWSATLKENNFKHLPELTKHPIFKIDDYCVQLPWMMANQSTNNNVINNLRRFANTRPELKTETDRIETNLANKFKEKGFTVISSYIPEKKAGFNPGEIDLICVLDNIVLVIEVKSTYRRSSQREAIRYKDSTLKKAGIQTKNKTSAVKHLLNTDANFQSLLGIKNTNNCKVIGWIADTSLEYDHEYFNGHLKVSIDELHIALADQVDLLMTQSELVGKATYKKSSGKTSLYPSGFNALSFVDAIENSKVWSQRNLASHDYNYS